jgi:metal-dependent amidase/aminoacylase/carboxypeptidase family protein
MIVDMLHTHAELAFQFKSTALILIKNLTSESTEKNQTMKTS